MNLGVILSIIVFFSAFVLTVKYREEFVRRIMMIRLPPPVLFVLSAFVLIYFEEQINCQPEWCWQVLFPPTLWPILLQVVIVGALARLFRAKKITFPVLAYVVFGIWLELTKGGLVGIGIQPLTFFMVPWVGISYAFVIMLPLSLLLNRSR